MKIQKIAIILFAAILALGIGWALFNSTPVTIPPQSTVLSSKPAPDFNMQLLSGEDFALKDYLGKTPMVINFWASWCPPCREEGETFAKVSASYGGKVKFVGVVTSDAADNAREFVKEMGISYDNGIDDSNIGLKYRITGIPETFWIDKNGLIIDHWIGAIDEANLTSRVRKLLQ